MDVNGIEKAFENFMSNDAAVHAAIDRSTIASYAGGSYVLELFEDGSYRVLWSGHIGNLYDSPGLIVDIPSLGECDAPKTVYVRDGEQLSLAEWEELSADEQEGWHAVEVDAYYENAIEALRRKVEFALEEMRDACR